MPGVSISTWEAPIARTFKFKIVAIILREDLSVWRNNWTSIACQDGKILRDRTYEVEIVDRVVVGDSFTAGFLYGWLNDKDVENGVRHGNAFAAFKHTFHGDFNRSTHYRSSHPFDSPQMLDREANI